MPWFGFIHCCDSGNDKDTEASGNAPHNLSSDTDTLLMSESALSERPLLTDGVFHEERTFESALGEVGEAHTIEKATNSTLHNDGLPDIEQVQGGTPPQPQQAAATDTSINPALEDTFEPEEQSARPLVILFNDNGAPKSITVPAKPLGMVYRKVEGSESCNVKMVSPGSLAERLGIQPGWKFVAIGGQPVANLPFEEVKAFFEREVETLPVAAAEDKDKEAPTPPLSAETQPGPKKRILVRDLVRRSGLCFKGKKVPPGDRVVVLESHPSTSTTASESSAAGKKGESPPELSNEETAGKDDENLAEPAGKDDFNEIAVIETASKTDVEAEVKASEPVEQTAEIGKQSEEPVAISSPVQAA